MRRLSCRLVSWLLLLTLGSCTGSIVDEGWWKPGAYELTLIVSERSPVPTSMASSIQDSAIGIIAIDVVRSDSMFGTIDFPWARLGLAVPIGENHAAVVGRIGRDTTSIMLNVNVNETQVWLDGGGGDTTGVWRSATRGSRGTFHVRVRSR